MKKVMLVPAKEYPAPHETDVFVIRLDALII